MHPDVKSDIHKMMQGISNIIFEITSSNRRGALSRQQADRTIMVKEETVCTGVTKRLGE